MARYLLEVDVAPQTFGALIKRPQNRADAIRPMFEAVGGKLEEYYFVVGGSRVYLLCDVPDALSLEALTMATLGGGAVTSFRAIPLMTAAEAEQAMRNAKDVAYRPPSS